MCVTGVLQKRLYRPIATAGGHRRERCPSTPKDLGPTLNT
jgi:hypothetical protein